MTQPPVEKQIELFPEEDLWVTQTGQAGTSLNGKTVFDLNIEYNNKNACSVLNTSDLLQHIKQIGAMDFSDSIRSVVYTGKILKENFVIEKYFIRTSKENSVLPFYILHKTDMGKQPAVLYLSPEGKEDVLNSTGVLKLLDLGYTLVCPDLPGTGELSDPVYRGVTIKGVLYNYLFATNLIGKSIPGIQAEALELIWRHLQEREDLNADDISAVIKGGMCSAFLHFAVFSNHFRKVVLLNPYISYRDLVLTRYYDPKLMLSAIPGALRYYDLTDLESLLAPTRLSIINPLRADGSALQAGDIDQHFGELRKVYSGQDPGILNISIVEEAEKDDLLIKLFRK
jgi:hypothetical protein